MGFFRSRWLKGIYPLLLLALLGASPFILVENPGGEKDRAEFVIHAPKSSGPIIASLRMLQIIYGLEAARVFRIPVFTKIISENYVPGTSFDPVSIDLLTASSRGPPQLIAIL